MNRKFVREIAKVCVVVMVIIIAVVTVIVWLISGEGVGYALARGISVLILIPPTMYEPSPSTSSTVAVISCGI